MKLNHGIPDQALHYLTENAGKTGTGRPVVARVSFAALLGDWAHISCLPNVWYSTFIQKLGVDNGQWMSKDIC
jgi:hypothetical protein